MKKKITEYMTIFCAVVGTLSMISAVGHVEAGLRTDNLFDPFPEEASRRLISQISSLHFAPTKRAYENFICRFRVNNL